MPDCLSVCLLWHLDSELKLLRKHGNWSAFGKITFAQMKWILTTFVQITFLSIFTLLQRSCYTAGSHPLSDQPRENRRPTTSGWSDSKIRWRTDSWPEGFGQSRWRGRFVLEGFLPTDFVWSWPLPASSRRWSGLPHRRAGWGSPVEKISGCTQ